MSSTEALFIHRYQTEQMLNCCTEQIAEVVKWFSLEFERRRTWTNGQGPITAE